MEKNLHIKVLGDKAHGLSMFILQEILKHYAHKVKDQIEVYISRDGNNPSVVLVSAKALNEKQRLEPFVYQTFEGEDRIPKVMTLELLNIDGDVGVVEREEILELASRQEEKRFHDIQNR